MNENINFLYCFDKNYNEQAFSSMISILENISNKVKIFIIHNEQNFREDIPKKITGHKNLDSIETFEFNDYGHNFPNIENVHISVATYFRLFIKNYLPNEEKFFIFLDPDVICIKDPTNGLLENMRTLDQSEFTISAKTEHSFGVERINVDNKYFNAGVMVIDFHKWLSNNFHDKLIQKLAELKENIRQWDQDVLNSLLNGNYLELKEEFNFKAAKKVNNSYKKNVLFVHFMGSHKPWLTSGAFEKDSNYYHLNYRKIYNTDFHIIHKWKTRSVLDLIVAFATFKIVKIKKPFKYIFEFIKSLFL